MAQEFGFWMEQGACCTSTQAVSDKLQNTTFKMQYFFKQLLLWADAKTLFEIPMVIPFRVVSHGPTNPQDEDSGLINVGLTHTSGYKWDFHNLTLVFSN